jgi:hypothetical protein
MGVFVPVVDGAQVEIVYTLDGQVIENRLWFWTENPPITQVELDGLAAGVYAWHTTNILPFLSGDLVLAAVEAKVWDVSPPVLISVAGPSINGGVGEQSHSANVAAVVRFRWPVNFARLKQNKNYVPGLPLSAIDLNTITPTYKSILFEAYAGLVDATRLFSPFFYWWWVCASAYHGGAPRTEQLTGLAQGPRLDGQILVGQRRKRLPEP